MKRLIAVMLCCVPFVSIAAPEDDCWKLLKPFVQDAKVKSVDVVEVGRHNKYKSINFWLNKKVPTWQKKDWDSMPRDVVSCKLQDGNLTHEYGSLIEMRENQARVNKQRAADRKTTEARFK